MSSALTLPQWVEHERPLFALYHGPSTTTRDVGVVLCSSFGHEMMATHRAMRHLADRLAEAGFPTVRVDYDGTGDSSGSDVDPDRGPQWTQSIALAVRSLERRGVRRIALVGLRFGALLAAEYAKHNPVHALVLVATPPSGRAYLRELRALHSLRFGAQPPNDGSEPGEELVGFFLRSDAAAYIEGVTIVGDRAPAERVLLVPRDDLPGRERSFAKQLTELGSEVTVSSAKGFASMGDGDPVRSVVPNAMWREVVEWLAVEPSSELGPVSVRSVSRAVVVRASELDEPVLEEIVEIDGMVGVLSSPADAAQRVRPIIALQNVGANHRVGCNRVYVELARRWAALGFSVLRYDLTGIGDTRARAGNHENDVYSDVSINDARIAIRWAVESGRGDPVVLGGICSGAYVSYYAALAEPRVRGLMLMNPLTFHWREGDSLDVRTRSTIKSTDYYRRAAFEWDTWRRVIRREVHLRAITTQMARRAWKRVQQLSPIGAENDVAAGFRRICDRGAHVIIVCGEDDASRDVVAEHLGPDGTSSAHANLRVETLRGTDHTFAPRMARQELAERLTRNLIATTPPRASVAPPPPSLRRLDGLLSLFRK